MGEREPTPIIVSDVYRVMHLKSKGTVVYMWGYIIKEFDTAIETYIKNLKLMIFK